MGIYDRDYYRSESRSSISTFFDYAPVCKTLILINVLVWIAYQAKLDFIINWLWVEKSQIVQKYELWRLLTAAFLHYDLIHILFNMLGIYWFGFELEEKYRKREFITFYLIAGILGNVAQVLLHVAVDREGTIFGASGAVMGLLALFAMHFPHKKLYLFLVLPITVTNAVVFLAAFDFVMTFLPRYNVATFAHLGGLFFGAAYGYFRWSLTGFLPYSRSGGFRWRSLFRRKPKLRAVYPDSDSDDPDDFGNNRESSSNDSRSRDRDRPLKTTRSGSTTKLRLRPSIVDEEDELDEKLDQVLAKIAREGRGNLSADEIRTLEQASQRARDRRKSRWGQGPGNSDRDRRR